MKIDQNASYLKNVPGNATPMTARIKGDGLPPAVTTVVRQAQLPSMNGDFDAARVAQIRESIAAGRYQVDTAKIADGLLASVRDLLNNRPS